MTTSTIPREEMGNATGLFNMLRNIGGSIGISMATTALIRRAALHQTEIGAKRNLVHHGLAAEIGSAGGVSGPSRWTGAGSPRLDGPALRLMEQQAALKAYIDVFRWTALLAFFCAAAAWLF